MAAGLKLRLHIIGGPGSGKSFIAGKLSRHFGVPAYDLDDLFWDRTALTYNLRADPGKRDQQLATIVSRSSWVIEGVYYQWLTPSFEAADIIIALAPSIWIRHWRVIRRFTLRRLGRLPSKRESLGDLRRLLCWSHVYDANNLVQARELIAANGRKLIFCKTYDDVRSAAEGLAGL